MTVRWGCVKTGTLMDGSNFSNDNWLMTMYLLSNSLKGVVSTKLGNDVGENQKTSWFMVIASGRSGPTMRVACSGLKWKWMKRT